MIIFIITMQKSIRCLKYIMNISISKYSLFIIHIIFLLIVAYYFYNIRYKNNKKHIKRYKIYPILNSDQFF